MRSHKRLVSKRQYVGYLGRKAGVGSLGLLLFLGGLIGVLFVTVGLTWFLHLRAGSSDGIMMDGILGLLRDGLAGGSCVLLVWLGYEMIQKARAIEPVAPLTRYNADQLPAEESLVRASVEPAVLPATVLLRAAERGAETPAEELLRSAVSE